MLLENVEGEYWDSLYEVTAVNITRYFYCFLPEESNEFGGYADAIIANTLQ